MSVYERLRALQITLPEVETPVTAFVPFVRADNLLFVSGHIAKKNGKPWAGKLGSQITRAGKTSGTRHRHRADGHVARRHRRSQQDQTNRQATGAGEHSEPTFTEQHLVANGASELFAEVFGEIGTPAALSAWHKFLWALASRSS
jgi:hypothetical protein